MAFAADQGDSFVWAWEVYTVLDSYAVTMDGGADEEESYEHGGGWYGLLWIDNGTRDAVRAIAAEEDDRLTGEEEELLTESVAVILFERSDGIVEADWYETRKEAEKDWAKIQKEFEVEREEEAD